MKNKIKLIFDVDVNMEDYDIRISALERHIKEVYPNMKAIMRHDPLIDKYRTVYIMESTVRAISPIILETLAGITVGILQLEEAYYQIGDYRRIRVTKKLKAHRASWYISADKDEETF